MTRWPVTREWTVSAGEALLETGTPGLASYRGCALLGSAGLGKTFEIDLLANIERAAGRDIRKARLADMAQSVEGLAARLDGLLEEATPQTTIYLDALDEMMVPVPTAGRVMASWIRTRLRSSRASVRISCRSAIFPESVRSALGEVYESGELAFATLHSLNSDAVEAVARHEGLDPAAFSNAIERANAKAFAEHPLTLRMLLQLFRDGQGLPESRVELFDQGLRLLMAEPADRREEGTAILLPMDEVIDAAERLACYVMLSGRETTDYGDSPTVGVLGLHELEVLPGGTRPLNAGTLRALRHSALFEGDGPYRFRFSHRQFAEFLAARRLARLLPHQTRALLASPLGQAAGVAGPLRETAAFAAMFSTDVAAWIATADPEIVGMSDVSNDSLRRTATLGLLDALRRHDLTDAQLWREGIVLKGLEFAGAEAIMRDALQERGSECEDILEGAIRLADAWNLAALSDLLADLVLDPTAPLGARRSAGYVIVRCGTADARARLKPLITGSESDPNEDLKGIALRCNYPQNLSTPELLQVLTPARRRLYSGAYSSFLYALDREGFAAGGHRSLGLQWARGIIRADPTADSDHLVRIAKRIARAAVDELDEPAIRDGLVTLLGCAARQYAHSPLSPLRDSLGDDSPGLDREPISSKPAEVRRRLLTLITAKASDRETVWRIAWEAADLMSGQDLEWLLTRAADESLPSDERVNYLELARLVPRDDEQHFVETWLRFRDNSLVEARIPFYLVVELGSEAADRMRKEHERGTPAAPPSDETDKIRERLEEALALAATKNARYFIVVAQLLTGTADGLRYELERFLYRTARWEKAPPQTQRRIVAAAKRLLVRERNEPRAALKDSLRSIRGGYMQALWLLLELAPEWVDSRPITWWRRWVRYFLRELHPGLSGESDEPKRSLVERLLNCCETDVVKAVCEFGMSTDPDATRLFGDLLELSSDVATASLDARVTELMMSGALAPAALQHAARYLLRRDSERALASCLTQLGGSKSADPDTTSVAAAVVLLNEGPRQSWEQVSAYIHARPDLATRILGDYAQGERVRLRRSDDGGDEDTAALSVKQAGDLAAALIEFYPYDSDPVREGAFYVGPAEAARHLRDRLIGWLSERRDLDAVDALRNLERRFGPRFPFLRRPRATAERGYRLSRWVPISPEAVSRLLTSEESRILRTEQDALDAVVAAIDQFAWRLQHSSPSELDDLWNRPRGAPPSPKEEERASDKVCVAIRDYLGDYAVTADREVQVFRRQLSRAVGGAPGSEVDVLCRIPAIGTAGRDLIAIPIEVKLAHNPEAATGMAGQLACRYMKELGTDAGVFVVLWLTAPGLDRRFRPMWSSTAEAIDDLRRQAAALASEGLDVRPVLIDASLPTSGSKVPIRKLGRVKDGAKKSFARRARNQRPKGGGKSRRTERTNRPSPGGKSETKAESSRARRKRSSTRAKKANKSSRTPARRRRR